MILPGSTVVVTNENSIYRGYVGCVQRIDGKRAAILMDSHTPWDKMITFRLSELKEQTEGFLYYASLATLAQIKRKITALNCSNCSPNPPTKLLIRVEIS